jgi:hypothetical protein
MAGVTAFAGYSLGLDRRERHSNLFAQGFSIDPLANAAGLTVSNAGKAKVGF